MTPHQEVASFSLPSLDCLQYIWSAVSYNVRYATRRVRFFRYYEELGRSESYFIIQCSLASRVGSEMISQLPAVRSVMSVPYVMPGLEMMRNTQSNQLMSIF